MQDAGLLEALPQPALVVDRSGLVRGVNEAAARFLGRPQGGEAALKLAPLRPRCHVPARCPA